MGHIAELFYVVYNLILTLRLFGDVGNCTLTQADEMVNIDLHARISTSKILAPNIIVPEFIIKQKESGKISAQNSLHQKAEAMTIDALILETGLIFYQKSLRQKLSLQQKLNFDEYNEKEKVSIPQLAAVFVAPNFGDGDQTPSLDALTGVQFVVGNLLLPTLSFPAPRSIPDGNIVLGGGSGGAVVIRGKSLRFNLFRNSNVHKLLILLHILFLLCPLTFFYISIVCSVYIYIIHDKILIKKRGLKVPKKPFCFRYHIYTSKVARCSGNIIYGFIILLLIILLQYKCSCCLLDRFIVMVDYNIAPEVVSYKTYFSFTGKNEKNSRPYHQKKTSFALLHLLIYIMTSVITIGSQSPTPIISDDDSDDDEILQQAVFTETPGNAPLKRRQFGKRAKTNFNDFSSNISSANLRAVSDDDNDNIIFVETVNINGTSKRVLVDQDDTLNEVNNTLEMNVIDNDMNENENENENNIEEIDINESSNTVVAPENVMTVHEVNDNTSLTGISGVSLAADDSPPPVHDAHNENVDDSGSSDGDGAVFIRCGTGTLNISTNTARIVDPFINVVAGGRYKLVRIHDQKCMIKRPTPNDFRHLENGQDERKTSADIDILYRNNSRHKPTRIAPTHLVDRLPSKKLYNLSRRTIKRLFSRIMTFRISKHLSSAKLGLSGLIITEEVFIRNLRLDEMVQYLIDTLRGSYDTDFLKTVLMRVFITGPAVLGMPPSKVFKAMKDVYQGPNGDERMVSTFIMEGYGVLRKTRGGFVYSTSRADAGIVPFLLGSLNCDIPLHISSFIHDLPINIDVEGQQAIHHKKQFILICRDIYNMKAAHIAISLLDYGNTKLNIMINTFISETYLYKGTYKVIELDLNDFLRLFHILPQHPSQFIFTSNDFSYDEYSMHQMKFWQAALYNNHKNSILAIGLQKPPVIRRQSWVNFMTLISMRKENINVDKDLFCYVVNQNQVLFTISEYTSYILEGIDTANKLDHLFKNTKELAMEDIIIINGEPASTIKYDKYALWRIMKDSLEFCDYHKNIVDHDKDSCFLRGIYLAETKSANRNVVLGHNGSEQEAQQVEDSIRSPNMCPNCDQVRIRNIYHDIKKCSTAPDLLTGETKWFGSGNTVVQLSQQQWVNNNIAAILLHLPVQTMSDSQLISLHMRDNNYKQLFRSIGVIPAFKYGFVDDDQKSAQIDTFPFTINMNAMISLMDHKFTHIFRRKTLVVQGNYKLISDDMNDNNNNNFRTAREELHDNKNDDPSI